MFRTQAVGLTKQTLVMQMYCDKRSAVISENIKFNPVLPRKDDLYTVQNICPSKYISARTHMYVSVI